MRLSLWKKLTLVGVVGAVTFQVANCAQIVGALASTVTAGGVLYLVRKVID